MIVICKAPRYEVNAQLIKRKILARNLESTSPNEIWLEIDEKYRAKVIAWYAASTTNCLWYSS